MIRIYVVIDGDYKFCNFCFFGEFLYNIVNDLDESSNIIGSNLIRVIVMWNFVNSFSSVIMNRLNNNVIFLFFGWQFIDVWVILEMFYDLNYFYYRNFKN